MPIMLLGCDGRADTDRGREGCCARATSPMDGAGTFPDLWQGINGGRSNFLAPPDFRSLVVLLTR